MRSAAATILSRIQREAAAWQVKNFGPTNELTMLAELIEEYGEAMSGIADVDLFNDAVADSTIYLMQFMTLLGWDIADMWEGRDLYEMPSRPWPILLGRISHHFVKGRIQQYRGSQGHHDDRCRIAIATLLRHWDTHLKSLGHDFVSVVEKTWREVSARDWAAARQVPLASERRVFEGVVKHCFSDNYWLLENGPANTDGVEWFDGLRGKRVRLTVEELEP